MKLGIIREGKIPTDARVTLSPKQCKALMELYPQLDIKVQPSDLRCFKDDEYAKQNITLSEDVSDCDVLIGVKEVPIDLLIPGKKYFFFSHTIKEQEHNRKLLQAILEKKIALIDWETLTDRNGHRVIAFGRWAGIVGGHNAIYTWLNRNKKQVLKRLYQCKNLKEASEDYKFMDLDNARILVSGTGRVSGGACEVLDLMGIRNVTVDEYNYEQFDEPVYAQLNNSHMFYAPGQTHFDNVHYHKHTSEYRSKFLRFTKNTDIFINGIYWDQTMPSFFTAEDMRSPEFRIKVIGDITCDIAPEASVPSTIRASTIAEPIYGYHPFDGKECAPYQENSIDSSVSFFKFDQLINSLIVCLQLVHSPLQYVRQNFNSKVDCA